MNSWLIYQPFIQYLYIYENWKGEPVIRNKWNESRLSDLPLHLTPGTTVVLLVSAEPVETCPGEKWDKYIF